MTVLVTGAAGFIGKELCKQFELNGVEYTPVARSKRRALNEQKYVFKDVRPDSDWSGLLDGYKIVVHLAASVHIDHSGKSGVTQCKETNIEGTINLAQQSAKSGVKRFVFLSSIGVNGYKSKVDQAFTESDDRNPYSVYTESKNEAELMLLELTKNLEMEVVIIRPPLVYGCDAPGNFASLLFLVKMQLPLPFGRVINKRSFIAVENLVDFILLCSEMGKSTMARNQVFVICDDEDVSTTQLLRKVAKAYGKKLWLIPVPVSWMKFAAKMLGKGEQADRLFGNLQVDCSKAKNLLGWKPVVTMDEQLKKMADAEK